MSRVNKMEPEGARRRGPEDDPAKKGGAGDETDTEGHVFLVDPISSRQIARDRSAEIEREARERQRRKEARPNRQSS
jgi:hypothetical protein